MTIVDLAELRIEGRLFSRVEPPGVLPLTDGWMHSGCAILRDGTVVVAHPRGRQLLFISSGGASRVVPVPVLEMHTILREEDEAGVESLWLVNNGHRFEKASPDYEHYRERGTVVRVDLDGAVIEELACPATEDYADRHWQPTSLCRDYDGALWVADGYETNLLHQYRDSVFERTVDGSETGLVFDCPHGLVMRGDEILVADRSNRRIVALRDGVAVRVLDAPLTSPTSMVLVDGSLVVTELFGGLAVFAGEEYVGHYARPQTDHTQDAWPNARDTNGNVGRPAVGVDLHSPHGIAFDGDRIVLTQWHIGGHLDQFAATS